MIDLVASTMDELQAEFVKLAGALIPIEDQRRQISAEMEKRQREAAAKAKLNGMTTLEKDAMRTVLKNA